MSSVSLIRRRFTLLTLPLILLLAGTGLGNLTPAPAPRGVEKRQQEGKEKKDKKDKKATESSPNAPQAVGAPVLWVDRGDIASLDLYWGSGGEGKAPRPPFTFVKEVTSGTNPKIDVVDGNGVKWRVKFAEEVHAEVAASRIVWATGYLVEENYFVAAGKVEGAKGLGRAKKFVGADGAFTNARFEKRPDNVVSRETNWSWDSNPFVGTKELSGLIILNALLNNWDAKVSNNGILSVSDADGTKEWYLITDWGGTFGKMGGFFSREKWNLDEFRKQALIAEVSGGVVKLNYSGKMSNLLKTVPVEHARWFVGIIGRLTDEQLRAAFKAAGASEAEITGFATRLREKISELEASLSVDRPEKIRAAKSLD
jgi:hypothetical protein